MATRTRLNITWWVHCLPCLIFFQRLLWKTLNPVEDEFQKNRTWNPTNRNVQGNAKTVTCYSGSRVPSYVSPGLRTEPRFLQHLNCSNLKHEVTVSPFAKFRTAATRSQTVRQPVNRRRCDVVSINKIQRDATVCRRPFTAKLLYMFRVSIAPIIRSTSNCDCSFWYRSYHVSEQEPSASVVFGPRWFYP
jgi:hypothetical protein